MPEPGYYESKDGERVQVLTVATHRIGHGEVDRPAFVVFTHGHGSTWCLTREEWFRGDWKPITRARFAALDLAGGSRSAPREIWALTTDCADGKPRWSTSVLVQRVLEVVEPADEPFHANRVTKVKVAVGRHTITRATLDGRVHYYREDARKAKEAYCKANAVRVVGAAEHFGYDGGLP